MGEYSKREREELLDIAAASIRSHFTRGAPFHPDGQNPKFLRKRGSFVTLHKEGELRGCIGHPLPVVSLAESVAENAVSAAFRDPRFPEVKAEELPLISIEISVLTVPRSVESPESVQVGRDGIIISKGMFKGLLLPQVPVEQGWGREEYLSFGCVKAGLPRDEWRRGVDIQVFQAEVFGEDRKNRLSS